MMGNTREHKHLQFAFMFLLLLRITLQASDPSSPTYTAAVVEYRPLEDSNLTANERTTGNVNNLLSFLNQTEDLDIAVFPESTIAARFQSNNRTILIEHSTLIPAPEENSNPCTEGIEKYPEFFVALSCGAQQYKTYLVANLLEKYPCSEENCADDGWNIYNTDAVFDRNGTVISRYRKYNLFGEFALNKTSKPELSTFTTDFNVTFGHFICFDILFDEPANALVRSGVHDFAYPSWWFSELPFLNAPQTQKLWAYENNVNLLAAGGNSPEIGTGGSGIFNGRRGAHQIDIVAEGGSKVYVANVTKYDINTADPASVDTVYSTEDVDTQAMNLDNFFLLRDHLSSYTSQPLNFSQSITEETVCSGDEQNLLCCNFQVEISVNDTTSADAPDAYLYRMVAFSGIRSFSGVYNGGIETCGIIACINETLEGCGVRFSNYSTVSWPITFQNITIRANYSSVTFKNQYPNSVMSNIIPLPVSSVKWTSQKYSQEEIIERTYKLIEPQNRLLTFAIFGRDYSRDSSPTAEQPSSSSVMSSFSLLTFLSFIALCRFLK